MNGVFLSLFHLQGVSRTSLSPVMEDEESARAIKGTTIVCEIWCACFVCAMPQNGRNVAAFVPVKNSEAEGRQAHPKDFPKVPGLHPF